MDLIIMRHAIAEDRDVWTERGKKDANRPLTRAGRQKMQGIVEGLAEVVADIDVLGTSPFARAKQTANIVGKQYDIKAEQVKALVPDGRRDDVLEWLRDQPEEQTIAIVGHEPNLGLLTSWLLAAPVNHFMEYKKGGAAMLSWSGPPEPGTGWVRWMLTPNHFRLIAK